MKKIIIKNNIIGLFIVLLSLVFSNTAHSQTCTYILVRHAEKDTTVAGSTLMQSDPTLSKQGKKRAKKLVRALKEFSVDSIYSTNFIRTKTTVEPISKKYDLTVSVYNHKQLPAFANELLKLDNKTILIAGHSNSTPALVNLLIKKETYKALDESIYNKIFIVKYVNGEATVEIREY